MSESAPQLNRFERRKLRTRNRLKQATVDLMLENGYDAVTIQDITDRADLGRGTFYVHFNDKEDIVWTILEESTTDLIERIQVYIPRNTRHKASLFQLYLAVFEYADSNRDLLKMVLGGQGNALLAHRAKEFVTEVVQRQIPPKLVAEAAPGLPVSFVAHYKSGSLLEIITWWIVEEEDYTPKEMAAMFYLLDVRQKPPTDEWPPVNKTPGD